MVRLAWVLAASLLVACGGSNNGDLTSGSGGSHADASAGSGGSAGSGTGGGTSTGGAAGSGATGGATTGGSGGTAGTTGGSGGTGTGGTGGATTGGAGGTGGASGGTGGQPAAGSVNCGLKTCTISTQSCCFGDQITPYCYKKGTINGCKCGNFMCDTAIVNCDGPEDCPAGQVCCAKKLDITASHFDHLSCAISCQGTITVDAAVVCHLKTSGECDKGQTCVTDPRLPGSNDYGLCSP